MSHCKNNFNDVVFPKHWKVLAFMISFSLTGAKTLESVGLLSSWCDIFRKNTPDKSGDSARFSHTVALYLCNMPLFNFVRNPYWPSINR